MWGRGSVRGVVCGARWTQTCRLSWRGASFSPPPPTHQQTCCRPGLTLLAAVCRRASLAAAGCPPGPRCRGRCSRAALGLGQGSLQVLQGRAHLSKGRFGDPGGGGAGRCQQGGPWVGPKRGAGSNAFTRALWAALPPSRPPCPSLPTSGTSAQKSNQRDRCGTLPPALIFFQRGEPAARQDGRRRAGAGAREHSHTRHGKALGARVRPLGNAQLAAPPTQLQPRANRRSPDAADPGSGPNPPTLELFPGPTPHPPWSCPKAQHPTHPPWSCPHTATSATLIE